MGHSVVRSCIIALSEAAFLAFSSACNRCRLWRRATACPPIKSCHLLAAGLHCRLPAPRHLWRPLRLGAGAATPKKRRSARRVATGAPVAMTYAPAMSSTSRLAGSASLQCERFRVLDPRCRRVFVTRLDWLATTARCTQRCAMHVGALGRERANTAVAKAEPLHDRTFKDLDTICRCSRLHASQPIGVDEIAIRKGHDLFIVVSDLDRWRPIGVGGTNRTEADRAPSLPGGARTGRRASRSPRGTDGSPSTPRARIRRHRHASSAIRSTSSAISATRSMRSTVVSIAAKARAGIKG